MFYTTNMKYIAHRGASAYMPHNSLPAFALAREMGATCYELDVHLTKDQFLVVHHDYSLKETTGSDVLIKDLSSADLKKYPLKHAYGPDIQTFVPLLKDVIPVIEEEMELVNMELKNDGNVYPGIEAFLLTKLNLYSPELVPKTLFSSFDYETLLRLRQMDKNIHIGMLCREFDLQKALAVRACSVHMNQTRITPEIIKTCHDNGLKVCIYTVNTVQDAARLEVLGADAVFTDKIDLFVKK